MDSRLGRLQREFRKAQTDAAEAASRAAEMTSRLVRKQREIDVFMEHYNRKAKHDLDELEAEDNERERALAAGEMVDETQDDTVDPSLVVEVFSFLDSCYAHR